MRVLVTGAHGQLGSEVTDLLARRDDVVVDSRDSRDLDITSAAQVDEAVGSFRPDVVVNGAAWTGVDAAEEREADALRVNADGPRLLAEACVRSDAWLLQVSTDYVFDGTATTPYSEDAQPSPRSAYGRTKLAGELAVRAVLPERSWIVRTAWLYGRHGANFPRTMAGLERARPTVDVVDDQRGQPTSARDLAERIVGLIEVKAPSGVYHGTNSGDVTWCGFAREVFRLVGADPERVLPTTSAQFMRPAPRPAYSVLGHAGWLRAGMAPMRDWRMALTAAAECGLFDDL